MNRAIRIGGICVSKTGVAAFLFGLCVLLGNQRSNAAAVSFVGRAPINFTSSIPGIIKHDVFYFDLTIDDSIVDTDHRVFPNGPGGVTALGEFADAVVSFKIYAYPGNQGGMTPKMLPSITPPP